MKKLGKIIFPILTLIIFILIMTTGGLFKKPFGEKDNVIMYINNIDDNIQKNNWKKAKENMDNLEFAWEKVDSRIQFGLDKDRIFEFENSLAHLKGAIYAKDKKNGLINIQVLLTLWERLEN